MGSLVAQTKGIDELLETLRKSPAAKTLTVWGLSLNWAKDIPLALAKLTRKELVIRIFVPTDDVITNAFVIDAPEENVDATFLFSSARAASIDSRLGVLDLRLREWSNLKDSVARVEIYRHNFIPNDFGALLDDKFVLMGSYNWIARDSFLVHSRNEPGKRLFHIARRGRAADEHLIEGHRRRFLCRTFDSSRVVYTAGKKNPTRDGIRMTSDAAPESDLEEARVEILSEDDKVREVIRWSRVPEYENVFILGSLDRRVTIYAQQVRALNLIWALAQLEKIEEDSKVAVVGGGVAGVMAACAAAKLGSNVRLIEQQQYPLHVMTSAERWIHPHIYDWPRDESDVDRTALPFLGWKAGRAADVQKQMTEEFKTLRKKLKITVTTNAVLKSGPLPGEGPYKLGWKVGGDPVASDKFDAVIFAVGFGEEKTLINVPSLKYWSGDDLDATVTNGSQPAILISGCGDGGLTDFIRCSIGKFNHSDLGELMQLVDGETKARLLAIDSKAMTKAEQNVAAYLWEEYRKLSAPKLDKALQGRRRKDVQPFLNGPDDSPLTLGASILNRFIVSRLFLAKGMEYIGGRIKDVTPVNGKLAVTFEDGTSKLFDRIIVRHGTVPSLQSTTIWKQAEKLKQQMSDPRIPRPQWPASYWDT